MLKYSATYAQYTYFINKHVFRWCSSHTYWQLAVHMQLANCYVNCITVCVDVPHQTSVEDVIEKGLNCAVSLAWGLKQKFTRKMGKLHLEAVTVA